MSTGKTTIYSAILIAVASMAIGMVIASRFDLVPASTAQTAALQAPPVNSAPLNGPIDADTFRRIAEAQSPMVVNIRTESKRRGRQLTEFFGGDDFFRRFFGQPAEPPEQTVRAAGTGFIIDKEGHILTNNHVIEDATKVEVAFFGADEDEYYEAKVLGRDELTDSALLELVERPTFEFQVAQFGDSSNMRPGDWVMAIGNPFNLGHTVTVGVISAVGRPFWPVSGRPQQVLQTDAAINPGNSGGPLLNVRGEVVGINTAILSDQGPGNIGIGFAFPINMVRELLPQLRTGKVTRGMLGVTIQDPPRDSYQQLGLTERAGAVVTSVRPNGPAEKGGLQAGDVIVRYNGQPVADTSTLQERVTNTPPGTRVPVEVVRNGERVTLQVVVEELDLRSEGRPPQQAQQDVSEGFGMALQDLTPQTARRLNVPAETRGAVVVDVQRGGSAEAAGLQPGDVIVSVNRVEVGSVADATRELANVPSGRTAFLLVQRGQQRVFFQIRKE